MSWLFNWAWGGSEDEKKKGDAINMEVLMEYGKNRARGLVNSVLYNRNKVQRVYFISKDGLEVGSDTAVVEYSILEGSGKETQYTVFFEGDYWAQESEKLFPFEVQPEDIELKLPAKEAVRFSVYIGPAKEEAGDENVFLGPIELSRYSGPMNDYHEFLGSSTTFGTIFRNLLMKTEGKREEWVRLSLKPPGGKPFCPYVVFTFAAGAKLFKDVSEVLDEQIQDIEALH